MSFEKFKAEYEHKPVTEYPNQIAKDPLVSVCVQTYQHAPYIKECLDGILMQKTNFSFEILLGEDDSSDGTREICLEYAEKHPNKIRLFLHHRENNIQINGKPTGRFNFLYNLYSARGKYIAFCEGDDYWISKFKLKRQAKFLDKNPDYAITANHIMIKKDNSIYPGYPRFNRDLNTYELLKGNPISTPTVMFRAGLIHLSQNLFTNIPIGDWPIYVLLSLKGKIKLSWNYWSVYRIHQTGIYSLISKKKKILQKIESRSLIKPLLPQELRAKCDDVIESAYNELNKYK